MKRILASALVVVALLFAFAPPAAQAALQRMGPINNGPTVGGFPAWFQDSTGVTMEFCDLVNQAELNGGWCTLIPPTPSTAPESFPNNFFIEHFYWDATNITTDALGLGVRVRFTMAMEASFTNGAVVVPGQQMTFGRIRLVISPVPFSGDYTVYHPYGKWTFPGLVAGDRLFFTDDVGLGCPGTFDCTLGTSIGPFLLPSAVSGGAEVPPIPDLLPGQDPWYDVLVAGGAAKAYPGTGKKYLADPGRIGPVTGSPLAPFLGSDGLTHDHNTLRIEGPNGFVIDAPTNFTLTGRFMTAAVPGKTDVTRASYGVSATGNQLDVFATASEATSPRLPTQPVPPTVTPLLSYYEGPCAGAITINLDGTVTVNPPPYTAPATPKLPMAVSGINVWGQSQPAVVPDYVCVEDDSARNAAGQIVPAFYLKPVTDVVSISLASFNGPSNGTMTVNAVSSDPASVLTLAGYGVGGVGLDLAGGVATVPGLLAPPATVQVTSSNGGVAILPVTTVLGAAVVGGLPVAANDTVTMFEDCSPNPATSCATPLVISPLANDTFNGGPIPAGAIVTIKAAPRLGTAVVNADGTITFTPNANANGADSIVYTVTVPTGQVSNQATIAITITPVNDLPVAIGDTTGALRGVQNTVKVLANDTDPDGAADLASAVIVTGNANLGIVAGTVYAGGLVTFTPPANLAAGPQTFTYNAVDQSGAVSVNPATVTVNVSTAEAIVPQKAIYTQKTGRWTLAGTDSPPSGQTLTIKYTNGIFKVNGQCPAVSNAVGTQVGTAVVDGLGNWLDDHILGSTIGIQNPSNTGNSAGFWCTPPSQVTITSSLSPASVNFAISLK